MRSSNSNKAFFLLDFTIYKLPLAFTTSPWVLLSTKDQQPNPSAIPVIFVVGRCRSTKPRIYMT